MATRNSEKKHTKARKARQYLKKKIEHIAFTKKNRGHKLTAQQLEFLMRLHT